MKSQAEATIRTLAYEPSLAIAWATGAVPHYCYANVWHALTELESLRDASLVEGWITLEMPTKVTLIEHCWIEDAACSILDPSLVLLLRRSDTVFYFPALRRDQRAVASLACKELPLVRSCGTYGPDGMGNPDYLAAYRAASQKAEALASASHPGKPIVVEPAALPSSEQERLRFTVQIVSSSTWLQRDNMPSDRAEPDDGQHQASYQHQEHIDTSLARKRSCIRRNRQNRSMAG